ncbi:MAG: AIR carboxylase family protein [Sandaracinaceae bacterium]|nr:AIR carboxylase family protein [Sandaracinaceae bacterium]
MSDPIVGVIMGSQSYWKTMKGAAVILEGSDPVRGAHRVGAGRPSASGTTVAKRWAVGSASSSRAPAGGASPRHDGVEGRLPVIGVPVQTQALAGVDSLYSIVQMPRGYPVATMAIGAAGAANAGLMAASILALGDPALAQRLDAWRARLSLAVEEVPRDE